MNPEQFQQFLASNERSTKEAVEKFVNGKIDKLHKILENQNEVSDTFRKKMDAHILRVEPVIVAYEEAQSERQAAVKYGNRVIFLGKVVAGIVGIVLFAKFVVFDFILKYKP